MIFKEAAISGCFVIEPERLQDNRGFFARIFDDQEFQARGLESVMKQCSISFNRERGVLRGLHFQSFPHQETKLIRCTKGRIFDVIVDLREESKTYLKHYAQELDADDRISLLAPPGSAHGFLTLEPETEVQYFISTPYVADFQGGLRWDDPSLRIEWPLKPEFVSDRDKGWPLLIGS